MLFRSSYELQNPELQAHNIFVDSTKVDLPDVRGQKNESYTHSWNKLPVRNVAKLITQPVNFEVEENEKYSASNFPATQPEETYAMVEFQDMKNPISPITNRLADLVKKEVDFRTAKASNKKSGGFYVKIGKFEISHKKYKFFHSK